MNNVINETDYPYIDVPYNGKTYRFVHNKNDHQSGIYNLANEVFRDHSYVDGKCQINIGDVVLDGGAHIGTFTVFALIHGAKLVISVEPNPITFPILEYNVKRNMGDRNVVFVNKALWNSIRKRPNRLRFICDARHSGGSHIQRKYRNNCWVEGITIDAIEKEFGKIDFIKLDVEGSEREALAGAIETIKHDTPNLALCLYHKKDDDVDIPNIVKNFNASYGEMILGPGVYKIGLWGKPE